MKDFDPVLYGRKDARRMDRFLHFAVAAARRRWTTPVRHERDPRRVGVHIGSGIGGVNVLLEQADVMRERGARRVSPFTVPGLMLNSAAAHVSIMTGARGPAWRSPPPAPRAAMCRRGRGEHSPRQGRCHDRRRFRSGDRGDAVAGFENMGALSSRNDEPERASRPFDAGRDGFVMAEGAGVLILERLDKARARGARIYGELIGYGANSDALSHHRARRRWLRRSRLHADGARRLGWIPPTSTTSTRTAPARR